MRLAFIRCRRSRLFLNRPSDTWASPVQAPLWARIRPALHRRMKECLRRTRSRNPISLSIQMHRPQDRFTTKGRETVEVVAWLRKMFARLKYSCSSAPFPCPTGWESGTGVDTRAAPGISPPWPLDLASGNFNAASSYNRPMNGRSPQTP